MIEADDLRPTGAFLAQSVHRLGADRAWRYPGLSGAYDVSKALNAAAIAAGEFGFGAQWAGQGASLARSLPGAELVALLERERAAA